MCKLLIIFALTLYLVAISEGSKCGKVIDSGTADKDRKLILNLHNKVRKEISSGKLPNHPKPRKIPKLRYDDELEKIATKTALNSCGKRKPVIDERYGHLGLVRYSHKSSSRINGSRWEDAFKNFIKSRSEFKYKPISERNAATPYSQVIWSDSEAVGCGYAQVITKGTSTPFVKHYVCHYTPGGNVIGKLAYESRDVIEDVEENDSDVDDRRSKRGKKRDKHVQKTLSEEDYDE